MISRGTDDFHPVLFICLTKNIDRSYHGCENFRNQVSELVFNLALYSTYGNLPMVSYPLRKNYYMWIIVSIILNFVIAWRA
jgi:hypothetical protein